MDNFAEDSQTVLGDSEWTSTVSLASVRALKSSILNIITIDMILILISIMPTSAQAHNLLVEVVVPRKLLHFWLVGLNTLGRRI